MEIVQDKGSALSGILGGRPTERTGEEIGTGDIHISEIMDDDIENAEELKKEEDAVIQESKELVDDISKQIEAPPKVSGGLDIDTDSEEEEEDELEREEQEGEEAEEREKEEEGEGNLLDPEDSARMELDCSYPVS